MCGRRHLRRPVRRRRWSSQWRMCFNAPGSLGYVHLLSCEKYSRTVDYQSSSNGSGNGHFRGMEHISAV